MNEISPNLPAAHHAAVLRANAMMAEHSAAVAGKDGEGGAAADAGGLTPPAAAPATPPAATPGVVPPPAAPPPPPAADDAEHRYRSEKGRREQAERQVRELGEEVANLRRIIAAQQAAAPVVPKLEAPQLADEDRITDEEAADFGPDLLRVVQKQSRQVLAQATGPLHAEIARLREQVAGTAQFVQQEVKTTFLTELERLTEGRWQALNRDDAFLDWLDETDPYAGVARRQLLSEAQQQGNASRAAKFFTGYLSQQAATAPRTPAPAGEAPAAASADPVTLADFAAPGRAKGAGPPAPAEKPIWSQAEIRAFYTDVRRGAFAGRDAEKARLEADIIAAAREDRIRN